MTSHTIKASTNNDYIVLTVIGDFKAKDMMKYIVEAHANGVKMNIDHYLVDVTNARNIDSVKNNYDFAYSDMKAAEGINLTAKIVAVVSPEDHTHDFVETVLCNAGLPIKLFRDREKAIDYLKSKEIEIPS
jgi:hypothetical protein